MKETAFERLHYHSGLVAQGCWDELDDYDQAAIQRFGELIVAECVAMVDEGATIFSEHSGVRANVEEIARRIERHFEGTML